MALLKFFKSLNSLPGTLVADAIYLVKTGIGFDMYATNTLGVSFPLNVPISGADPWTYVKLAADVSSVSATPADTLLAFTPAASKTYVVEGMLIVQAAALTTGVRIGLNWPTGLTVNAGCATVAISATAIVTRLWGSSTNQLNAAATGVAVINEPTFAEIKATLVTGLTPSGNFRVTLATEVAASSVTIKAQSWIRYREI